MLAGAALLLQPAYGQGTQAPPTQSAPPPAGGGTTSPPGRTTPTPTTPTSPSQQSPNDRMQFPDIQRPIFLSGKVVLDDGTPPPETVVIERVCNGVARPEAYTDSKGRFSFELGRNQAMLADASVGSMGGMPGMGGNSGMGGYGSQSNGPFGNTRGGISERDLMGCELRAVLPGYRSEVVSLANRRTFDNPEVGNIFLHRLGNVEGRVISATSLNAPKEAKKAFEKAQDAVKKKKPEDALKNLQKAVEVYPKYAQAWYEMGRLQERTDAQQAAASYRQAIAADGRYIQPWLQLSELAVRASNWQEVADTTGRAIKLDPFSYPRAYFYNSVANYNLKKYDDAEKSAREAQKLDNKHEFPKVDHLLGILLAERRDYNGAAEQMRNYLKFAPGAQDAATVRNQLAEIEKLAGGGSTAPAEPPRQ